MLSVGLVLLVVGGFGVDWFRGWRCFRFSGFWDAGCSVVFELLFLCFWFAGLACGVLVLALGFVCFVGLVAVLCFISVW